MELPFFFTFLQVFSLILIRPVLRLKVGRALMATPSTNYNRLREVSINQTHASTHSPEEKRDTCGGKPWLGGRVNKPTDCEGGFTDTFQAL